MSASFLVPRVMDLTLLRYAFPRTDDSIYVLQIDTVLCGECASSSSSSSSEDEGMSDMMQASESADAPHEAVSNVVPLPSKVKAEKGRNQGSSKLFSLLHHSAHLHAELWHSCLYLFLLTCKGYHDSDPGSPHALTPLEQRIAFNVKANIRWPQSSDAGPTAGMGAVTRQSAAELVLDLPEGASVSVCQGKTCLKRGSNVLMAELQSAGATAASVTACKCLDKCKLGPNVEVEIDGKRQIVQVHSPVLALVG